MYLLCTCISRYIACCFPFSHYAAIKCDNLPVMCTTEPSLHLDCSHSVLCRPPQAINAAPYGVVGVLVYTDPLDINDGRMSDENETYPHSWYLPPSGVERGGYATDFGDLLTPYLAAKGEEAHTVALWPRHHQKLQLPESYRQKLGFCATMDVSPVEETYRIPEENITGIPPIPTQPIGFEDAQALIWFVMQISCS